MRRHAESATAVLLVLLVAGAACGPALSPSRRALGRLADVRLFVPAEDRDGFVFLFSDAQGWRPPLDDAARDLVRNGGVVVVGIDLPSMLERLAASDDGCHYVVADLEDASRRLELELGFPAFRAPVLAGVGVGATMAYAALAQSPAATIGGALGRPRGPALPTRVPLCAGARATKVTGGYTYEPSAALPGWLAPPPAPDATGKEIAAVVSEAMLAAASESRTTLAHLPLAEIPSDEPGDLLAVIFSGDGGWRDLDKTIGEDLAKHGVAVVGVDSLRYFWTERTPERVAADTTRIIEHYGARWDREHVMLIGYSFGAGILPFVVTRLPAETRARVVEVSLLGLEPVASFEFHVGEWLGMKDPTARPILPELEKIDPSLVQCVYGVEETDSICPTPQLGAIERIRTTGGHHFDGDYARLAKRILDGARRRAAARPDRDLDMSGADG